MTDRIDPAGEDPAEGEGSGGDATPSFALPAGATNGLPGAPDPIRIGDRVFAWGGRTYVMGIVNVTPDSFSGDGLLSTGDRWIDAALARASSMVAEGADILDVGGESSRPGHTPVPADEEVRRVVPVIAAIRAAHPSVPISVDTTKPAVAAAALDAGAALVNDVWGVAEDDALSRLAAERSVPIVLMHNRAEARYRNLLGEVVADLQRAIDRAVRAGVPWESIVVDPGFGFGKTPGHNLALLRGLGVFRVLARPMLLGTSRKSTLGRVLDLPADERLEATLATTALAAAAGVDIVRVHDVKENVRVARMADAIVRAGGSAPRLDLRALPDGVPGSLPGTRGRGELAVGRPRALGGRERDRIVLAAMAFDGRHGALPGEKAGPQPFEVDVELRLDLRAAGSTDDLGATVDYGAVFAEVRRIVETTSRDLIEAIAEEVAREILVAWPTVEEVVVRVRKMRPPIDGRLAWAGVEVRRARDDEASSDVRDEASDDARDEASDDARDEASDDARDEASDDAREDSSDDAG